MEWLLLVLNSLLLGVGLAMDAFSVSIADGLNEPDMKKTKSIGIASTFGIFQAAMPMIGWICVHTIVEKFERFEYAIPFIALILLSYIGGKMIIEAVKGSDEEKKEEGKKLTFGLLMVQGIATAIDALSVGFTIADYSWYQALTSALIICVVTVAICLVGLLIGKKIGKRFEKKASIFGGIILIGIGLEIFISGIIELFF